MAFPHIERWNNHGSMLVWHYDGYPSNFPGYHLMADKDACIFLIGLVDRFRNTRDPARKVVSLEQPTEQHLSIPNCKRKCIPADRVEFRYREDYEDGHWMITRDGGEVSVDLGFDGLSFLDRGAADMLLAEGDWAAGEGDNSLWFWRHPATTTSGRTI